jgi:hypothetical protein
MGWRSGAAAVRAAGAGQALTGARTSQSIANFCTTRSGTLQLSLLHLGAIKFATRTTQK